MNITQTVKDLHDKQLSNREIAASAGLTQRQILSVLTKNNLKSNRWSVVNEDDDLNQFIIGAVLGDGCITKETKDSHQSKLSFGHSLKQEQYLLWKLDFLKKYNLAPKTIKYYTQISDRYIKGQNTTCVFKSKAHPYFSNIRKIFYPNGVKNVEHDMITNIDALGLAIWYMDDGCICKRSYQIYTNSFSIKEVEFLQSVLKKNFNIISSVDKNRVIYIKTCSKDRFTEIIKPYVIPCMLYKIRGSV